MEGEVTAAGRKLVGSAQRTEAGVMLQHGSLPIEDDQFTVTLLLRPEFKAAPADAPATLAGLLGAPPAWDRLVEALAWGWREALGVPLLRDGLTDEEVRGAEGHRGRFEDPAWTWHR